MKIRTVLTLLLAIAVVVVCCDAYILVIRPSLRGAASRANLSHFAACIDLGSSERQLEEHAIANASPDWLLRSFQDSNLLIHEFATPTEFGAKNWILYVAIRDGVVAGVGIRIADGNRFQPSDAPEDRYLEGIREEWCMLFGPKRVVWGTKRDILL